MTFAVAFGHCANCSPKARAAASASARVGARRRARHRVQRPLRLPLHALGQRRQYVLGLVHPAALLARAGEDLPERRPEAERPVADGQLGVAHAALAQLPQQLEPGLRVLAVAVLHGHEFLAAVGPDAHQHQAAEPVLLKAHVEVHAVRPAVAVADRGEAAPPPALVLRLPRLAEPAHARGGEARLRAEEGRQRRDEVARREPAQVAQRQQLGHLRRAPHVGRQQRRDVALPVAAVIDARRLHGDAARGGRDRSRAGVAVAHDEPPPFLIDGGGVTLELGLALGLQRHREQLLGGQAAALVQADLRPGSPFALASLMHYPQHPAYSSRPASSGHLLLDSGRVRLLSLLAHPQLSGIPLDRQGGGQEDDGRGLVVGDGDWQVRGYVHVAAAGGGVGQGILIVARVLVLVRLDGYGLDGVPVSGGEGQLAAAVQGGARQDQVGAGVARNGDGDVVGWVASLTL